MRVLMFGWEFPPHLSGGLGTACYGMTRALAAKGTDVVFVLPKLQKDSELPLPNRLQLRSASGVTLRQKITLAGNYKHLHHETVSSTVRNLWENHLQIRTVDSPLFAYATPQSYMDSVNMGTTERNYHVMGHDATEHYNITTMDGPETVNLHGGYGPDLLSEVFRYSQAVVPTLAEHFDVIHAHDWMTYPAGMVAKFLSGKPLVVHIHAMEADRSGQHLNHEVAAIERAGLEAADVVVAVSHYTKDRVANLYGINPDKIEVVHNAVTRKEAAESMDSPPTLPGEKRVLFMGRVTYQKGPDYFVEAAKLVHQRIPNVRFIMAGNGDMLSRMVRRVAQLRMGSRFHFTGFLKGTEVDRMYALSDLYVMPSVSEPFGIAPLEAMAYDVPVLMSRQSGVSEVVVNALKVDFWDIREMANKICAVLTYPRLAEEMVRNCREELKNIRWENAANKLNGIYTRCSGT